MSEFCVLYSFISYLCTVRIPAPEKHYRREFSKLKKRRKDDEHNHESGQSVPPAIARVTFRNFLRLVCLGRNPWQHPGVSVHRIPPLAISERVVYDCATTFPRVYAMWECSRCVQPRRRASSRDGRRHADVRCVRPRTEKKNFVNLASHQYL